MKFGRNLPRNQVPEWSSAYIKYKALKKLVNSAGEAARNGVEPDLAEFFYTLDRNLEDVDAFYNRKLADASRRLKLLEDRYERLPGLLRSLDRDERRDFMGALLELRGQLRKLQWYAEVNRRGFIKITKKLDKKVPGVHAQPSYLESSVDPRPFATNIELSKMLTLINSWLSELGEAKGEGHDKPTPFRQSAKRLAQGSNLSIPDGIFDSMAKAVQDDDPVRLPELLTRCKSEPESQGPVYHQRLLLDLLQRSISSKAKACIEFLLGQLDSLNEEEDINGRNCIHRLVVTVGKSGSSAHGENVNLASPKTELDLFNFITPATTPILAPLSGSLKEYDNISFSGKDNELIDLLQYILNKLLPHQRSALQAKDSYGRMALHYAAQYGLVGLCEMIIQQMRQWNQYNISEGIDSAYWQDAEGWAPVHLSVMARHPMTTRALLDSEERTAEHEDGVDLRRTVTRSNSLLSLATKANSVLIVKLLVEAGFDINYQDEQGETALHVAARYGHDDCAKVLLKGTLYQKADIELAERTFCWTPLFVACVDGNSGVVELLIDAGAQLNKTDLSGWTAREHAVLRGHIGIARRLAAVAGLDTFEAGTSGVLSVSPPSTASLSSSLDEKTSYTPNYGSVSGRPSEPVKRFGHRYLTGESLVLVSLGTMDTRKIIEPVQLDRIPFAHAHSTQLDTALSLVVSAKGANGEPSIIDLPVQDNVCTEAITFTTPDPSKVKILFDIVPTYAGSKDHVVGRGVAMLSSIRPTVGSKRSSLQGDVSVPVMAANTLDVIGMVNFNFLVITPFQHPNMSIKENQTYWKSMTSPMVIGHRGLGKNLPTRKSLQLGENTIQSFIAAASLGASYVEFDVQLTKDHVPVIYHDFLVSETGIDAPVHTLTLEQFLHVSNGRTPRQSRPPSPVYGMTNGDDNVQVKRRVRSLSATVSSEELDNEMKERMKHTRDFKIKGYKANSRGNCIQAPFTTLEEMFKKLPASIGFNIEMKYPMLFESEEQGMDTYAVEVNSFVDCVLTKVYDLGKGRDIIFSSFNPDVCLLLSFKQPSIPVLFLTDAGTDPAGDIRATSLQEAIRFASRWNLLGLVIEAEPLILSPRLVRVVKESGLVCVSYGTMNNTPENVQLQVREGIDAVIVDSVLAIRKDLTADKEQKAESFPAEGTGDL